MQVILDASAITVWNRCREEFRETYLAGRASATMAVHREAGIAIHRGVEELWKGSSFEQALKVVMDYFGKIPESRVHTNDKKKWEELKGIAPTMLATYADTVDTSPEKPEKILESHLKSDGKQFSQTPFVAKPLLEYEWSLPQPFGIAEMALVGRIDRVEVGPILIDTKTATEMDGFDEMGKKVGWERSYRASMVKDQGLGLYDFWLRQIGLTPAMVALEVILKPSERYGKRCRVVRLELPEVLAYRERFDMLLEFTCKEIVYYVKEYSDMAPWPMNTSACSGKYGNCHFLALCNAGLNPRTEKLYTPKVEHLSIKGKRIEL